MRLARESVRPYDRPFACLSVCLSTSPFGLAVGVKLARTSLSDYLELALAFYCFPSVAIAAAAAAADAEAVVASISSQSRTEISLVI